MSLQRLSGLRLFRLFGIDVYLHWTWLVVALIEIENRRQAYTSIAWNIAEYLALFAIVLLHEFGHALACRSVGGRAERILLWPFGGVAFVQPPQRPGAVLWSIAAGPLVNVALAPITIGALLAARAYHLAGDNLDDFLFSVAIINIALLAFNMLPIYPLDGGQILRSILWFIIGKGRSLMVASIIGLIGAAGAIALAAYFRDVWLILLAALGAMQSWNGLKYARAINALAAAPRYETLHCPSCHTPPPAGPFWTCPCGQSLDLFASQGVCPRCAKQFPYVLCPNCGVASPPQYWIGPVAAEVRTGT